MGVTPWKPQVSLGSGNGFPAGQQGHRLKHEIGPARITAIKTFSLSSHFEISPLVSFCSCRCRQWGPWRHV